jgi:hypothetical protein
MLRSAKTPLSAQTTLGTDGRHPHSEYQTLEGSHGPFQTGTVVSSDLPATTLH